MIFEEIGYFSKTQGLKGQLQLNVLKEFDIANCKVLFVQLPTGQSPQFINTYRETKNGFLVTLDDIDTIELAKTYVGKKVQIDSQFLFEEENNSLIGYTLFDENYGEVGAIQSLEDTGANLILNINHKGKQVLLPYNEDLVLNIDDLKKTLYYQAPEGLIEMYL